MNGPNEPFPGIPEGGPSAIVLAPGVTIADRGTRIQYSRGSGPGGQNVNKVNTKADIWIAVSQIAGMTHAALDRLRVQAGRRLTSADDLHLVSEIHRTQEGNRREIFDRLREMILVARREPKRRRKTRPTASSNRRRLESKKERSEIKARRSGHE